MNTDDSFLVSVVEDSQTKRLFSEILTGSRQADQDSEGQKQRSSTTSPVESRTETPVRTGIKSVVTDSWLYGWLTKEPEPDVIVIDLRKTGTIAPVIRVLDWVIDAVQSWAVGSQSARSIKRFFERFRAAPLVIAGLTVAVLGMAGIIVSAMTSGSPVSRVAIFSVVTIVGLLGIRENRSWKELTETRTADMLRTVLEPPEPREQPESENETGQRDAEAKSDERGDRKP